jgi:hypothetical protein
VHHRHDFLGVEAKPGFGQVEGRAAEAEGRGQLELAHDGPLILERP